MNPRYLPSKPRHGQVTMVTGTLSHTKTYYMVYNSHNKGWTRIYG